MLEGFSKRHLRRLAARERKEMTFSSDFIDREVEETKESVEIINIEATSSTDNFEGTDIEMPLIRETQKPALKDVLADWYLEFRPSTSATRALLQGLHEQNLDVPLCENTLVKTKVQLNTRKEIKTIKKDLDTIKQEIVSMKKDLETNKSLLEKVVDNQAKILAYFTQSSKKGTLEHQAFFPLENEEQMQTVDRLSQENKTEIINVIKRILNPGGLQKNFHRLVDNNVIFLFNYDGVNGKKAFKDYKSLNSAIFEAVKNDGYTYTEYVKDIRISIKALKNRIHKRKYDENKKTEKKIRAECTHAADTT